MAGVNKVILVGNLGRDPEIRRLNSGASVANLRIATSESWRDKTTGERQERTEWHNVVIFNENLVHDELHHLHTHQGQRAQRANRLRSYHPLGGHHQVGADP